MKRPEPVRVIKERRDMGLAKLVGQVPYTGWLGISFERKGDDLYTSVDVDLYTALLGGKVPVETFGGKLLLTIEPGTQNGQKIRLRGRGMPRLRKTDEHGDLYAEVSVRLPERLTARQRALLEEMRQAGGED